MDIAIDKGMGTDMDLDADVGHGHRVDMKKMRRNVLVTTSLSFYLIKSERS